MALSVPQLSFCSCAALELGTLPNRKGCLTRARRQSSPPARKTVLILFEFLIFPSPVTTTSSSAHVVPQLCVLCVSSLSSCLRVTVAHHFFFSYLCLAVCSCLCVILKVKNIKFSSVPPLIFLQQCPTFLSSRALDPQYRFFCCFCTLYLLNFSLLILHCIFLPPLPLEGKTFSTQSLTTSEQGSSTPC